MINQINALETCWYISPPWGRKLSMPIFGLLERVYVMNTDIFAYCCGMQWEQEGWNYAIAIGKNIIYTSGSEITGTGRLHLVTPEKPVFRLGELVEFRFAGNIPKLRTVLGIQLINQSWFYVIEWKSPTIDDTVTSRNWNTDCSHSCLSDRLAWVTDYDLMKIKDWD
ncbi:MULTISPECIES: DUF1392 family protein [unclassified Anabaena]|uniref:DUF1392 family protein n=1 Tax=unclassified Anabaena TaxID=2619674 RepID=UPI00082DA548|nr:MULTISPECIES: DUF1392 family protein [unclassified Anabaena]